MTVTLPYDPEWKALAWAKENCPSYITNKVSNTTRLKRVASSGWVNDSSIVYYFSDERDVTFFMLRWS